jgi:predicted dehydrogenase
MAGRQFMTGARVGAVAAPLALNSADCRLVGGLARDARLVLMVGHTFRFSPAVRQSAESAHA